MSYTDTEINKLVFNRLSNAKYNELKLLGKLNPNEFYITPDSEDNPINIKDTITNCLTNIPENIKLELTDTEIILKAGSVVYLPNGKNEDDSLKFEKVVIQEDITTNIQNAGNATSTKVFINVRNNMLDTAFQDVNMWKSTDGIPTENSFNRAYDYTNNDIYYRQGTDNWVKESNFMSLPIAIATTDENRKIISIDKIFNGFGYFDRTLFALPGVEGLIPNGRGKNGELINNKFSTENLILRTFPENNEELICTLYCNVNTFGVLQKTVKQSLKKYYYYYNNKTNYNINLDSNDIHIDNIYPYCKISDYFCIDNGKIIDLDLDTVFQATNYSNINMEFENILNTEKSNCITKVSNDINLIYITNKTLTLKANSDIYIPYGLEIFKRIRINSDIIKNTENNVNTNTLITCIINPEATQVLDIELCDINKSFSSNVIPENFLNGYWYDTLNNKIYFNEVSENNIRSLPIGYIDKNNQIHTFNGFGFIGNTIFALPGIEGLIPYGRDLNNKLYSIKLKNYKVQLREVLASNSPHKLFAFATTGIGIYNYIYDWKKNELSNANSILYDRFVAGKLNISNDGRILDLSTDYPFGCVNYNEFDTEINSIKLTSYHKRRDISCSGETVAKLYDSDEYVGLYITDNTTVTFDISNLTFPKDIFNIKVFTIFPNGQQKTISLISPSGRPFMYVNNKTPIFTNKLHWFELTTGKDWTTVTFLDIGDEG